MAKAKKKKRNKRTPQQLEKMRQKQREAMERNTLMHKKRIEDAILNGDIQNTHQEALAYLMKIKENN